ncbi:MAG TPA: hypothetical protein VD903_02395 [Pseudonocardia sp.]|nr:hypothetical protein [Pseudonocardia sp.]
MARSTRPRSALIAVLVTAVLATAGCTSTLAGAPTPAPVPAEGPGSDPVAWAGQVCGAVLSYAVPATSAPDFAASDDLPAVQRAFSGYLGDVVTGVQQGRAQLAEIGRAPDPAGDEAVREAATDMASLEEDFSGAKNAVDTVDATDPQAFMSTLARVESTLARVTPPNPIAELDGVPLLQRAAGRAEPCRELTSLAASLPR